MKEHLEALSLILFELGISIPFHHELVIDTYDYRSFFPLYSLPFWQILHQVKSFSLQKASMHDLKCKILISCLSQLHYLQRGWELINRAFMKCLTKKLTLFTYYLCIWNSTYLKISLDLRDRLKLDSIIYETDSLYVFYKLDKPYTFEMTLGRITIKY